LPAALGRERVGADQPWRDLVADDGRDVGKRVVLVPGIRLAHDALVRDDSGENRRAVRHPVVAAAVLPLERDDNRGDLDRLDRQRARHARRRRGRCGGRRRQLLSCLERFPVGVTIAFRYAAVNLRAVTLEVDPGNVACVRGHEEQGRDAVRPGMREVADRAGVAMSSVSRVLSGHPDVSQKMRQVVMGAVRELGYRPDMLAQGLRRGTTFSVGFTVSDIANPVLAEVVTGAEKRLREAGYSLLLTNSEGDPALDVEHISLLERRRVDGLIL